MRGSLSFLTLTRRTAAPPVFAILGVAAVAASMVPSEEIRQWIAGFILLLPSFFTVEVLKDRDWLNLAPLAAGEMVIGLSLPSGLLYLSVISLDLLLSTLRGGLTGADWSQAAWNMLLFPLYHLALMYVAGAFPTMSTHFLGACVFLLGPARAFKLFPPLLETPIEFWVCYAYCLLFLWWKTLYQYRPCPTHLRNLGLAFGLWYACLQVMLQSLSGTRIWSEIHTPVRELWVLLHGVWMVQFCASPSLLWRPQLARWKSLLWSRPLFWWTLLTLGLMASHYWVWPSSPAMAMSQGVLWGSWLAALGLLTRLAPWPDAVQIGVLVLCLAPLGVPRGGQLWSQLVPFSPPLLSEMGEERLALLQEGCLIYAGLTVLVAGWHGWKGRRSR